MIKIFQIGKNVLQKETDFAQSSSFSAKKRAFYQNVGSSHVLLFVREHISQCQICSPLMILYFLFDVRNVGSWKRLKKSSKKAKKMFEDRCIFFTRQRPFFAKKRSFICQQVCIIQFGHFVLIQLSPNGCKQKILLCECLAHFLSSYIFVRQENNTISKVKSGKQLSHN